MQKFMRNSEDLRFAVTLVSQREFKIFNTEKNYFKLCKYVAGLKGQFTFNYKNMPIVSGA